MSGFQLSVCETKTKLIIYHFTYAANLKPKDVKVTDWLILNNSKVNNK